MKVSCRSNLPIKYDDLVKRVEAPTVVYVAKFDDESARKFSDDFNRSASSPQLIIPIVINSPGGTVDALMQMVDICRSSRKLIATVTMGKAASCGAVLATVGWQGFRFAGPLSRFLIHDVSTFSAEKAEEIMADAREALRLNEPIYRVMAENCQKPDRYFWDLVQARDRADWFLTAPQALEHNIVNHIRVPEIKVDVTASYSFE